MTNGVRQWRLYVITDATLSARGHLEVTKQAIAGGADAIQFREKHMSAMEMFRIGQSLRKHTRDAGVDFIVNDRLDLALALEADGVHLGQEDLPISVAREILGPEKIIGGSARTPEEASVIEDKGADYVGVGPVFEARDVKPDTIAPQGIDLIQKVCERVSIPVIAIGGIHRENARAVTQAGAGGIAVIRAVVTAPDIQKAARELKELVSEEEV